MGSYPVSLRCWSTLVGLAFTKLTLSYRQEELIRAIKILPVASKLQLAVRWILNATHMSIIGVKKILTFKIPILSYNLNTTWIKICVRATAHDSRWDDEHFLLKRLPRLARSSLCVRTHVHMYDSCIAEWAHRCPHLVCILSRSQSV